MTDSSSNPVMKSRKREGGKNILGARRLKYYLLRIWPYRTAIYAGATCERQNQIEKSSEN
jgi:hypothetical protein